MKRENRYDVIVLGATFAAAGLAQVLGSRCLVLEAGPTAGTEFLGALHFGDDYAAPLQSDAAKELREEFEQRGAFSDGRICLLDCAAPFYRRWQEKELLLNTAVAGIEKNAEGFAVLSHGTAGFRRWQAACIIDTRAARQDIVCKTFNALIAGREGNAAPPQGISVQRWGYEGDWVLQCPVAADADPAAARAVLEAQLEQLAQHRLLMIAEDFACTVSAAGPYLREGIVQLPSCAYRNPLLAFDAGVLYGEEVLRHAAL